jgi:hypothetical protein
MDRESGHARSIAKMLPRVWFDVSTLAQPGSEHDVVDYLDADARGDDRPRATNKRTTSPGANSAAAGRRRRRRSSCIQRSTQIVMAEPIIQPAHSPPTMSRGR